MIAFTEYVQDRQIRGVRKQISSYQGMERGMWSDYSKRHRVLFWGNRNILKLEGGGGHTTL